MVSDQDQDLKELKLKAFAVIWSKMLLCDEIPRGARYP